MSRIEIAKSICNRRWLLSWEPFAHATASHVLSDDLYSGMEAEFRALLARGLSETSVGNRFSRNPGAYDTYSLHLNPAYSGAFDFFASRQWHDMLSPVFSIETTKDVSIELHHHPIGSVNGSIHNDFSPGWFSDNPRQDGMNIVSPRTNYKTGHNVDQSVSSRETMRAIALLFYLNNPPWAPGNGGETGLYKQSQDDVNSPAVAVHPVNNSLVAFECTPFSYHSFISNKVSPRNCIVMWLHRDKSEVVARWGDHSIAYWRRKG